MPYSPNHKLEAITSQQASAKHGYIAVEMRCAFSEGYDRELWAQRINTESTLASYFALLAREDLFALIDKRSESVNA